MNRQLVLSGTFVVPPCFALPPNAPKPGTLVGAGRWPWAGAHYDCWGKPWSGTVLAPDDPRAWHGTLAFPCRAEGGMPGSGPLPSQEEVREHLLRVELRYLQDMQDHLSRDAIRVQYEAPNDIPVLWHFDSGDKVFWERLAQHDMDEYGVKPYERDVLLWRRRRKAAASERLVEEATA